MPVKPIPDGYRTVTPYLVVRGVPALLDFVKKAFGAEEIFRFTTPDGGISHAEVRIGDSMVMMGEAHGDTQAMPCMVHLYVEDSDSMFKDAIRAGATVVREMADQFYGDRAGGVKDPAGNQWWISTHKEDVTPEEMKRRMETMQPTNA